MKDPDNNPTLAFLIGITFGCLVGMALVHYFSCLPLKNEVMKRGYGEYVLTNPKDPSSVKFIWK